MMRATRTASQRSKAKAKATLGFFNNLMFVALELRCCDGFTRLADLTAMVESSLDLELLEHETLVSGHNVQKPKEGLTVRFEY